jgi:O-acetyl-ADP-ribose deacetylase (regulator of RNase III)
MHHWSWSVQPSDDRALELLAYNIHREAREGGELKREVAEAAGNRGGGKCGTAEWGGWKWVDRAGRLYELCVRRPSESLNFLQRAFLVNLAVNWALVD